MKMCCGGAADEGGGESAAAPIEDETNGLNQGGNGMVEQFTCTALQLLQHFKTKNCDKISL